jgi:hypothetical protein
MSDKETYTGTSWDARKKRDEEQRVFTNNFLVGYNVDSNGVIRRNGDNSIVTKEEMHNEMFEGVEDDDKK